MTKQEALAAIGEKLETMKKALREAQELADEHSLTFKASLDLPPTNSGKGPFSEYGNDKVSGTYYGKGTENYGDGESNKEGYWYWQNSSLNC